MQDLIGPWSQDPTLAGESLEALCDLNQRFLELLLPADAWWGRCGLTPAVVGALGALSFAQRKALANCPYALFDLRFGDEAHWHARLEGPQHWHVADQVELPQAREFSTLGLFYAWHVAARGVDLSQLLLGMGGRTAAAFRRVRLNDLAALAGREAQHLRARWHQYPAYWNALIAAAARADEGALRRTQLYGLQLTAAARL